MTSGREDDALKRFIRRILFANSTVLKHSWLPNRRLSTKTVRNRLLCAGYYARRPNRCSMLTPRHKAGHLFWCQQRRDWNLRSWRKIHWSDKIRFLLHMTDGRVRVWMQRGTAYAPRNIQETVMFGGGSVMVWGCDSNDCKMDLISARNTYWTNLPNWHTGKCRNSPFW